MYTHIFQLPVSTSTSATTSTTLVPLNPPSFHWPPTGLIKNTLQQIEYWLQPIQLAYRQQELAVRIY